MKKQRLDDYLIAHDLVSDRSQAQRLIMAGQVRVDQQLMSQPGVLVAESARIELDNGPKYVSRGGEKLEAALAVFPIQAAQRICADVGASTGGFTDCLLQHGAARVYAIDVGHGILAWKLRQDKRVIVMESTNARYQNQLPEPVSLVTIDASFISLKTLLPVVQAWGCPKSQDHPSLGVIALVKPQFEARRTDTARGKGVIRDPAIHRQVLEEVAGFAQSQGYGLQGLIRSPITGPKGNQEFLAWLVYPGQNSPAVSQMIEDLFSRNIPQATG